MQYAVLQYSTELELCTLPVYCISKDDYCKVSVLALMSMQLYDQLQSVLSAAAHLIFTARTDVNSPLLSDLRWLCFPECQV